jgi:hypothetical protein
VAHQGYSNISMVKGDMDTMSQSEKIRRMAQKGRSNGEIAKALGIRYQTVWRTLHRPYKGIVPQEELEQEELVPTQE